MPTLFIIAKYRNNSNVLQLVNEETVVHPYNEMLHHNKKEQNTNTHNNMNRYGIHKKPD